ncbi:MULTISPECIES: serine/threonine-protein kinase [Rhodopirellula]|jgi:serine/threonine-protein kinase|uniref:serine/threonine-protein kinase n=1 Tax=Rhodopirellula TaxID=265488 RepID=UPI00258053BF|nr:serine/threonine-protein kinase [Rhodopirellula sp. UBA1907]
MIARIRDEKHDGGLHYDRETLNDYLHDRLDADTQEVTQHIEVCEQCQAHVERLVTGDVTWEEVGELLREPIANGCEHRSDDFEFESEAKDRSSWIQFLQPSEAPGSIGRFARYEIHQILGRGGMGIVMEATDTSLGRRCAVKVLAPELATSAAARKRFSREAKSAAAVVHPHVVPIQTVDEHEGLPYLVMSVVDGPSLQQRVDRDGPLSLIETVRIASQIADGLAAAHEQGLVHRDIKPANVLLENGVERVQITDFGLARAVDDASMTRSGVIAGTPQYMSPEQAHGDSIDHRSDLFSLGSVIHFMLSGRSPFRAETTMGVLNRIGNDQPRSLRQINPDVPEWLDAIVARLLSKDPDLRYQSSSEVAELLTAWQAHLLDPANAKAPESASQAKPLASRSGISGRFNGKLPWVLVAGMFGFFAWAATVIILQTDQGTLRIESSADANVPIVIRKGNKVVEELTVTSDGASVEVKAGEYVIEIAGEADGFEVLDQSVVIQRGETQVARIALLDTEASDRPSAGDWRMEGKEPPKISPFTRMEYDHGKVLVEFESKTYQLSGVDQFTIANLVLQSRALYGRKWKKRLSEDLVELLWEMKHFPGDTVDLSLKDLETGERRTIVDAKMTEANRNELYRDNEHNQPENDGDVKSTDPLENRFPMHWGGGPAGYQVLVDQSVKHSGEFSASLESTSQSWQPSFGTIVQAIQATEYTGKRIRFSGFIKTDKTEAAGLWLRVDSAERGTVGFDNMQSRRIEGTNDWQEVQIVLDVPKDASVLTFGAILSGAGRLWVDDLSLAVVDQDVEPTRPSMQGKKQEIQVAEGLSESPLNLDFEFGVGLVLIRPGKKSVFERVSEVFSGEDDFRAGFEPN